MCSSAQLRQQNHFDDITKRKRSYDSFHTDSHTPCPVPQSSHEHACVCTRRIELMYPLSIKFAVAQCSGVFQTSHARERRVRRVCTPGLYAACRLEVPTSFDIWCAHWQRICISVARFVFWLSKSWFWIYILKSNNIFQGWKYSKNFTKCRIFRKYSKFRLLQYGCQIKANFK